MYGSQADGMHPTGMLSCYIHNIYIFVCFIISLLLFVFAIFSIVSSCRQRCTTPPHNQPAKTIRASWLKFPFDNFTMEFTGIGVVPYEPPARELRPFMKRKLLTWMR